MLAGCDPSPLHRTQANRANIIPILQFLTGGLPKSTQNCMLHFQSSQTILYCVFRFQIHGQIECSEGETYVSVTDQNRE